VAGFITIEVLCDAKLHERIDTFVVLSKLIFSLVEKSADPSYSSFGQACLNWLFTNGLGILVLWWSLRLDKGGVWFSPSEDAVMVGTPVAFLSLLFMPMMLLLMHELLLIQPRHKRLLATGGALCLVYLTICGGLVSFFVLTSHRPFSSSLANETELLLAGWRYLLALLLATAGVYWRGLFRADSVEG
jgi:hypothetical protein